MREGDKVPEIQKKDIYELISNSNVAFINGQYHEAYYLANEAIKIDENCAPAYLCVVNVCLSLSRFENGNLSKNRTTEHMI